MSTAPLVYLTKVGRTSTHHTPTPQLLFAIPINGGVVESCAPCWARSGGIDGDSAKQRWKRQRRNIRTWPSVSLRSTPTPAGEEYNEPPVIGPNTENLQEVEDVFASLNASVNDIASPKDGTSRSRGRVAGRTPSYENPQYVQEDLPTVSAKVGNRSGMAEGRLRLKWGIDLDIQVPTVVEALVKGPWDPQGAIWGRQLDMALEVIQRSGGVVFLEQLLPILNPNEGPSDYFGANDRGGDSGTTTNAVNESIVRRLLYELKGVPEVTSEGDILYVFRGLANTEEIPYGSLEPSEDDRWGASPEVLQFEEVSGFLEALPKMLNDKGPELAKEFFQRTTLSGLALFMVTCLLLGQLFFGHWPLWLASGPGYLLWVAFDDTLKRSRNASAKLRDQFRGQWADACRGDSDAVWRKRAAARSRARKMSGDKSS